MNGSDRFVQVGPLTVPRAALEVMLHAEAKGVHLTHEGDDLFASPTGILTAEEKIEIKRWRWHVLAILSVIEGQEVQ